MKILIGSDISPYIFAVLLILGGVFLALWWMKFREKIGPRFPNILLKKYSHTPLFLKIQWLLRISIVVLSVSLFWNIELEQTRMKEGEEFGNIVIALDISRSMLETDIFPNRLEKAKILIQDFVSKKGLSQVAYIVFAGKPFILSPLTSDTLGVQNIIKKTSTYTIRQSLKDISGSNIGDTIMSANISLSGSTKKSLILLTDGRANTGIDPIIAAEEAKRNHVKIYTIALGKVAPGMTGSGKTSSGSAHFEVDEKTLEKLSQITDGVFYRADQGDIFERIFGEIEIQLSEKGEKKEEIMYTPLAPITLFFLFILIVLHEWFGFLLRRKFKPF